MTSKSGRKAVVKGVALAVAPEAAIPTLAAEKAAEVATKFLTGDLVVVRTLRNIGTKKNPIWQEREVHYNLMTGAVGTALVIGGLAALAFFSRDRTRATIGAGQYETPGWFDNYNRTVEERGWVRKDGQLFARPPKRVKKTD